MIANGLAKRKNHIAHFLAVLFGRRTILTIRYFRHLWVGGRRPPPLGLRKDGVSLLRDRIKKGATGATSENDNREILAFRVAWIPRPWRCGERPAVRQADRFVLVRAFL